MIKDEKDKKTSDVEETLNEEQNNESCNENCDKACEETKEECKEEAKEDIIEGLKNQNNELMSENKKLQNEVKALQDRLSRIDAEYENFRNRTEREKKEIYNTSCSDVLKNILPVLIGRAHV